MDDESSQKMAQSGTTGCRPGSTGVRGDAQVIEVPRYDWVTAINIERIGNSILKFELGETDESDGAWLKS